LGPSVHRFDFAELDDNMMYAVWDDKSDGELVIAIRVTNPKSISDWFVEDFYVTKTVPWRYAQPENTKARISKATDIGFTALKELKGKNHSADHGYSVLLEDFLIENAKSGKLKNITVTGHSLAGALAPVLALWIKDNVFSDPSFEVTINVLPIAGATLGNAEFANYYDQHLAENTNRLHNPFDAVPQAWTISSMRALPSLYYTNDHFIKPNELELGAFGIGTELAKGKNYTQIKVNQASTGGRISELACMQTFSAQAGWQHHCGYYEALGMTKHKDKPILNTNAMCLTQEYCGEYTPDQPMPKGCKALFEPYNCTTCD